MNRPPWIYLVIGIVIALFFIWRNHEEATNIIEYRGQQFQLTKAYSDYDDYKNDPNNLVPAEIPRIEKLILEAKIGPNFATEKDFFTTGSEIAFPGYGSGNVLDLDRKTGKPKLFGMGVEIPRRDKNRFFIVMEKGKEFVLIDDFVVGSENKTVSYVRLDGNKLYYFDTNKKFILERPFK